MTKTIEKAGVTPALVQKHEDAAINKKAASPLRPDRDEAFWDLSPGPFDSEPPARKITKEAIDAMKVPELKAELQSRGLPFDGARKVLASRLAEAIEAMAN